METGKLLFLFWEELGVVLMLCVLMETFSLLKTVLGFVPTPVRSPPTLQLYLVSRDLLLNEFLTAAAAVLTNLNAAQPVSHSFYICPENQLCSNKSRVQL